MGNWKHDWYKSLAGLLVAFLMASPSQGAESEREFDGVRLQVDNDLFAGRESDRDYTGGFAVTVSGRNAREGLLSLDPVLTRLDDMLTEPTTDAQTIRHARQLGLMAFTPANTLAREALPGERPYANLLFVANGRVRVDADMRSAWVSSLTVGVLGLSLAEDVHDAIHEVVGSERPRGYHHQISDGGEPTARYTLAHQRLWIANPSGTVDVKTTVQGSVGFLTETSAAISIRMGRFSSSWWSFAPELTDYIGSPVPFEARGRARPELYFFAGARLKAQLYNVFLQGQFRHSDVRYTSSDIEPLVAMAWVGVVTQLFDQTQLSYTINYQTAEVRHGDASRDALWGGVQLSHSF
jgi:hypothetical protein